jgi:spore germination protein
LSDHIGTLQKRTIIVNGYATAEITKEQLVQWADYLTYVSYYSYGFNMDGSLVPIDDKNLIRYAFESGIAPLMVLTPFNASGEYSYALVREVFTNPVMRDRLIENIFITTADKNYYGVVFNFGPIAVEDRDQFVITVSKTAARLNRRSELVMVSLEPGSNDAGINYESLGRAANFIELRIQWEQIQMNPAAISPIDKMRKMLTDLVPRIESGNILLGLTPSFSEGNMAWYEDARSVRAELELVKEFNMAGVSIWTIMYPFPAGVETFNELFTAYKINFA